jgi:hypothetical protein
MQSALEGPGTEHLAGLREEVVLAHIQQADNLALAECTDNRWIADANASVYLQDAEAEIEQNAVTILRSQCAAIRANFREYLTPRSWRRSRAEGTAQSDGSSSQWPATPRQ